MSCMWVRVQGSGCSAGVWGLVCEQGRCSRMRSNTSSTLPMYQGKNLALTVVYVLCSLDGDRAGVVPWWYLLRMIDSGGGHAIWSHTRVSLSRESGEGHTTRRCQMVTCPESYITKYTMPTKNITTRQPNCGGLSARNRSTSIQSPVELNGVELSH